MTVSVRIIQAVCAAHYGLQLSDMTSPRRAQQVCRPRMVAMYLSRELTKNSLPAIGAKFWRDHTTVMHAVSRVTEWIEADKSVARDVDAIRQKLVALPEIR